MSQMRYGAVLRRLAETSWRVGRLSARQIVAPAFRRGVCEVAGPLQVERVISGQVPWEGPLEVKLMECLDALGLAEGTRHVLFLSTFPDTQGMPASLLSPEQGQYRLHDPGELVTVGDNHLHVRLGEVERLASSWARHPRVLRWAYPVPHGGQ